MCGRSRFLPPAAAMAAFAARPGDLASLAEDGGEAFPGSAVPGVVLHRSERLLSAFTWGFFDDGGGHNARVESAPVSAAWRDAWGRSRLILPVEAFVEGRAWFRAVDGGPMAVAGLFRLTRAGRRATMLTRPADATVAPYHDRMPVLVPLDAVDDWLAGGPPSLTGGPALAAEPVTRPSDQLGLF